MENSYDDIRLSEELPDGSFVYEVGPEPILEQELVEENIALELGEEALKKISSTLLEAIEEDIEARKPWMEAIDNAEKYLSCNLEDIKSAPFPHASRAFDTTMTNALYRYYALVRAELLPDGGPAGFKIEGDSSIEAEEQGEKLRDWLNYYLTLVDKSYYSDFEKFILRVGFEGTGVKKVYYDKLTKRVLSRFITRENFIIDSDCTSILESNRLTHVLYLSKREIILNQQKNLYRNVELKNSPEESEDKEAQGEVDLSAYSKRSLFPIYEIHTYLNLNDFLSEGQPQKTELEVPLPYIVTIDKNTREVLAINKNWDEEDSAKKRINWFVLYNYLPSIGSGFGIYGFGLAHLLGSNAITSTILLRQSVDAGTFKNMPGGIRKKGFKQQKTEIIVGPGQWPEVDTGADNLADVFMPLPYSEPSPTLIELRREINDQNRELGSTSELGMFDSKEDMPVGTTLAALETNNRIQSAVLKSMHFSLSEELEMIHNLFKVTLEEEVFPRSKRTEVITQDDFIGNVKIVPISDPSVNSFTQRVIKAESLLSTALSMPEIHNMREVYAYVYKQQGLSEELIKQILLPVKEEEPPQPDPASELLLAEIEQKKLDSEMRERIENRKAEVEIFSVQMKFETEKQKLQVREQELRSKMTEASLKANAELQKQEMQNAQI